MARWLVLTAAIILAACTNTATIGRIGSPSLELGIHRHYHYEAPGHSGGGRNGN